MVERTINQVLFGLCALVLAACGTTSANTEVEQLDAAASACIAPEPEWEPGQRVIACPDGTQLSESATVRFCLDEGGNKHGPAMTDLGADSWRSESYWRGERHGQWLEFEGDVLVQRSVWACGLPDGLWQQFRQVSGELLGETQFVNGTGTYLAWHDNGQLAIVGDIVDGGNEGQWTYYDELGRLTSQGEYVNGLKSGRWETYGPEGQVLQAGRFQAGLRVGTWTEYYADGAKKSEVEFVGGQETGHAEFWHGNGALAEKGAFVDGEREGLWRSYTEDELLRDEAVYVGGEKDGVRRFFHPNGQLSYEEQYEAGEKSGPYRAFWPDGTPHSLGQHTGGRSSGIWYFWTAGGEPESVCDFDLDTAEKCVPWDIERWPVPTVTTDEPPVSAESE